MQVAITTTKSYFGGVRYWFVCPRCAGRVGKLYAVAVGALGCRTCLRLAYEWQYRKDWEWRFLRECFRPTSGGDRLLRAFERTPW